MEKQKNNTPRTLGIKFLIFILISTFGGIPVMAKIQVPGGPIDNWLNWGSFSYFAAIAILFYFIHDADRKKATPLILITFIYLFLLFISMVVGVFVLSKLQVPGVPVDIWVFWGAAAFYLPTLYVLLAALSEVAFREE